MINQLYFLMQVEIKVLDVNDNSPEFKYNYMDYLFIPENTTINKNLSFAAFDRDSGQNAEITYYLQEENNGTSILYYLLLFNEIPSKLVE